MLVSTPLNRVLTNIIGSARRVSRGARLAGASRGNRSGYLLFVLRRCGRSIDAVVLAGPGAKVVALAAGAAKGPIRVLSRVPGGFAAARAGYFDGLGQGGSGRGSGHRRARHPGQCQAQSARSSAVSSVAGRRRPSASGRIRRTDTIRRWPVISGTKPQLGSIRTRRSW